MELNGTPYPNNLKSVRRQRGVSVRVISERTRIPVPTLFKIQAGKTALTIERREAIADALGVQPRDLGEAVLPGTPGIIEGEAREVTTPPRPPPRKPVRKRKDGGLLDIIRARRDELQRQADEISARLRELNHLLGES